MTTSLYQTPAICCRTKKETADEKPRPDPSVTSPSAAVASACHGVRAAMPIDLMPSGRNLIVFGTAADGQRIPLACFMPLLILQQQNARIYYAARLCPTKQTSGTVYTIRVRATYYEMCSHVSPRFRLHPHLLSRPPPAAAAVEAAAAVTECTQPLRAT